MLSPKKHPKHFHYKNLLLISFLAFTQYDNNNINNKAMEKEMFLCMFPWYTALI